MSFRRVEIRKDGIGFCYEGSWIVVSVEKDLLRIAEEISYEVAIGSQLGKIQIIIQNGKAYVESPLGKHEISNSSELINAIKKINEEVIKAKNVELYEKINKILEGKQ